MTVRNAIAAASVALAIGACFALACSGNGDGRQPDQTSAPAPPLAAALLTAQDLGKGFAAEGPPTCLTPQLVAEAGHDLVASCGVGIALTTEGLAAVRSQAFVYSSDAAAAAFLEAVDENLVEGTFRSSIKDFPQVDAFPLPLTLDGAASKAFILRVSALDPRTTSATAFIVLFQQGQHAGRIIYESFRAAMPAEAEMQRLAQLMITRIGALPASVLTPAATPAAVATATPAP